MISRDALLAELARVLAATRPDEADALIDHEDLVLAVAETDLFAYEPDGTRRWSEFIDPPHVVTRDRDALVIEEQLLGTVRRICISDRSAV